MNSSSIFKCSSVDGDSSDCVGVGYYIAYYDTTLKCLLPVPGKSHCESGCRPVLCKPHEAIERFGENFTGVSGQCYLVCCVRNSSASSSASSGA